LGLLASIVMDAVAGWSYTYGDVWVISGLLLGAKAIADTQVLRNGLMAEPAEVILARDQGAM
jgi:hypothetical protein